MKITINDLGIIKKASFTLGDLTIICGENNTGKTYATHAAYGFFDFLRSSAEFPLEQDMIDRLFKEGTVIFSLTKYSDDLQQYLTNAARQYSKIMFKVFAGRESQFEKASLNFDLESEKIFAVKNIKRRYGSAGHSVMQINSSENNTQLKVSLIIDKTEDDIPPRHIVEDMLEEGIRSSLLDAVIPRPFIASAERTGAAIFQRELDFTKNRIVELLGDKGTKLHPMQLLSKFSGEYPIAVRKNVDFIRSLPDITNLESVISRQYPEILDSFRDIIGGDYKVSREGEVQFIPLTGKRVRLSLVESSSAVRSLLDVGFYLRHIAMPGDLLMVDEPELNLHPKSQRKVAHLFIASPNDFFLNTVHIFYRFIETPHFDSKTGTDIGRYESMTFCLSMSAYQHYKAFIGYKNANFFRLEKF